MSREQRKRFEQDLKLRHKLHRQIVPKDDRLISALAHGFPDCAGVALGVNRLVMLATKQNDLAGVISFPFDLC